MTSQTATKEMIGKAPNSRKKKKKGLDEIDLWAMRIGSAERNLNTIRPNKKYKNYSC